MIGRIVLDEFEIKEIVKKAVIKQWELNEDQIDITIIHEEDNITAIVNRKW